MLFRTWFGSRLRGLVTLIALLPIGGIPYGFAQEKGDAPKKEEAPEAKDAPAAPAPAAPAPAAPAPAAPAPATPAPGAKDAPATAANGTVEAFQGKLTEWKNILKELRTIRQKHLTAQGAEAAALEKQWTEQIAAGEALLPQLRTTGIQAYPVAKDDGTIERFLRQVLDDDITHDRYEEAAVLGKALLDGGCDVKKVLDQAGVAAFCVNDIEAAEKYLKQAGDAGTLSEKGQEFLALVPSYKEFWKTEQELRAAEAAAKEDAQLPRVKISTTKGDLVVELFENEAPGAVGNFISLVEKKYYDGLAFHRVLAGFMAQGGCPKGDGTGGPGYNIYCETTAPHARKHFRGTLSMAHAGKDTGGSQFFITFVPTPHLNGQHTAFGRVIEGIDVLAKINRIDPSAKGDKAETDKMVKVEVVRKRNHEYKPNKVQ